MNGDVNMGQEVFELFDFGRLQELVSLWKTMNQLGLIREDLENFVEEKRRMYAVKLALLDQKSKVAQEMDKLIERCPECGKKLFLYPVEEENGKGWKSRWFCENKMQRKKNCKGCEDDETDYTQGCGYERLDTRSMNEIKKEFQQKMNDVMVQFSKEK